MPPIWKYRGFTVFSRDQGSKDGGREADLSKAKIVDRVGVESTYEQSELVTRDRALVGKHWLRARTPELYRASYSVRPHGRSRSTKGSEAVPRPRRVTTSWESRERSLVVWLAKNTHTNMGVFCYLE